MEPQKAQYCKVTVMVEPIDGSAGLRYEIPRAVQPRVDTKENFDQQRFTRGLEEAMLARGPISVSFTLSALALRTADAEFMTLTVIDEQQ